VVDSLHVFLKPVSYNPVYLDVSLPAPVQHQALWGKERFTRRYYVVMFLPLKEACPPSVVHYPT